MKRPVLLISLAAVVLSLFLVQPAQAIYKWVDDQGMLHITDYPPPSKEAPAEEPKTPTQPAAPEQPALTPVQPAAPAAPEKPKAAPVTAPAMPAPHAAPATIQTRTVPPAATKQSTTAAVVTTHPSATAKGTAATMPSSTAAATPAPRPAPAPVLPMKRPVRPRLPLPAGMLAMLTGGFMLVAIIISAAIYVYFSLSMYLIAKKLNVEVAWMSWVPILQLWPFISSAGKPCWWVLLFFVPIVGFIVYIYLWMLICENLGRNKWLGLLILVPIVNMVLPGILAFSGNE